MYLHVGSLRTTSLMNSTKLLIATTRTVVIGLKLVERKNQFDKLIKFPIYRVDRKGQYIYIQCPHQ